MALMIPAVAGPLSELSQSVRVQGQRPDAFVTVFSRSMAEVVAQGIAASADERLPLLPGVTLHRGNLLFAVQEVEGVHSARPSAVMSTS